MGRTLSLAFRVLSHRYKIDHKIFEDLNTLWGNAVNEQCDSSNNFKIIDMPLTRLSESLSLYEFLFPTISYIYMLFFHLLYTFSCLRKGPGAGSLLSTSLVWNVVSCPQDSHTLSKPTQNELVKQHRQAIKWDRSFPHPIQLCVCVCMCVCFIQWDDIEYLQEMSVYSKSGVFSSYQLFSRPRCLCWSCTPIHYLS